MGPTCREQVHDIVKPVCSAAFHLFRGSSLTSFHWCFQSIHFLHLNFSVSSGKENKQCNLRIYGMYSPTLRVWNGLDHWILMTIWKQWVWCLNCIVVLVNGLASILHQKQDVAKSVCLCPAKTIFGDYYSWRAEWIAKTPLTPFMCVCALYLSPSLCVCVPLCVCVCVCT